MAPRRSGPDLPTGTITFLFTDIEGSTRLVQDLGRARWQEILEIHNGILREAIRQAGGVEVGTEGDSFFAVFPLASGAVTAAADAQRALARPAWPHGATVRVRMGMHTGEGVVGGDDYVGIDVHRAARIAAAGHGGQILLSSATRSLVEGALPADVALSDLGPHRLKGLAQTERLHQLVIEGLPSEFPAPHTGTIPLNLPPQRTAFVGRARELKLVGELLARRQLVTLTGPGGTGKTRLAIEACLSLVHEFPDGVFFVDLAPLRDPALVLQEVARSCGLRADAARPIEDALVEHLRETSSLLLLDNFESVLEAAPVVPRMLDASPTLRVLVTSRAPLRLSGEQELAVAPLGLPDRRDDLASVTSSDAVRLFVERAAGVDPGFELSEANAFDIGEIATRLDGLPLAIELAAARVKMLPPRSIRERLEVRLPLLTSGARDLPERQRTLRAAIGWSYDLLDDASRALFRRLSVFGGGWILDDADAVANPDAEIGDETFDAMERLVDHSLVRRAGDGARGPRFQMLETIREYALERLLEHGDADVVKQRHAEGFRALAQETGDRLTDLDGSRWGRVLEEEHDNMRVVLKWAISAGEADLGFDLISSLWRFWQIRGHLGEGRRWAGAVLEIGGDRETVAATKGLFAAGSLAYWQDDVDEAKRLYEEGLARAERLRDPRLIAEGHYNLGFARGALGARKEAFRHFEEAKQGFESLGDRRMAAHVLTGFFTVLNQVGEYDRAFEYLSHARAAFGEVGDRWGLVLATGMAAQSYIDQGRYAEAREAVAESFRRASDMEEILGKAVALDALAAIESRQGNHRLALVLAGAAHRLRELGQGRAPGTFVLQDDVRGVARSDLTDAEIEAAFEEGRAADAAAVERLVGGQG